MANSTLRAILTSLLILGSSLLVPCHLYAQTSGWGTATLIGPTFVPKAQLAKIAMDPQGNAIAVWAQGDSAGVLSIWTSRYDVGSGSWGTATLMENNSGAATLPQVGMDNNGNAVAVWIQNDGTFNRMRASRYIAGQGWGTSQAIENNPGDADFARVAVNGSGNAMALWKQFNGVSYDIWANQYVVGQGWGTATLLETSSQDASETWVAMDNSGNAMAVWRQSDGVDPNPSIWANRYDVGSGSWGTATLIELNPGFASFPHVGFDDSGNATVAWYQAFGEANSSRHIWTNRYVVGSGWGTPTRLDSSALDAQGPSLSVNGSGNAMAVWRQWDDKGIANSIWANRYDAASGWGTATLIETGSGAADNPDVAMDSSGNAIAVWKQSDGTFDNIFANRYVVGQGWGTATLIETQNGNADFPKVATDGSGNAIAVWQQKNSVGANRFVSAPAKVTTFTEVTTQAGLPGFAELNSSWCVIWGDYDGDGFIDLLTLGHVQDLTGSISQLWHNNGDGTFIDVTSQVGMDPHDGDAHGAVWADFDNDGRLDLFVSKGTPKTDPIDYDELWHNNGDGTFSNIAHSARVASIGHRNRGSAAVDYNNDSFLDIFVTSFQRPTGPGGENLFYVNNGDLTFTDVAAASGLQRPNIQNRTVAWADFNGDGLLDVFITQSDALYKNNGDGTFTDVTDAAGIVHNSENVQASAWGDYDNDGYPDLYVTLGVESGGGADGVQVPDAQLPNILYHNNGDGTFTDVTTQSGTTNVSGALGVTWEDYDNDGNLDLYIVNSGGLNKPNKLFRNNGNGTFTDAASQAGVGAKLPGNGRGSDATFADYDNDGFPDLIVDNGGGSEVGTYILFHNNGNSNGWLKVVLRGTKSNLCGIGAKLSLVAGGKTQYRQYTGQHYMGQDYIPVHFGLGQAAIVDSLTITWPSGTTQTLTNIAIDQTITVVEP